jgi:hypothetical protein
MAGSLEMHEAHDRHQVPDVEAVRGRVKSAVAGNLTRLESY